MVATLEIFFVLESCDLTKKNLHFVNDCLTFIIIVVVVDVIVAVGTPLIDDIEELLLVLFFELVAVVTDDFDDFVLPLDKLVFRNDENDVVVGEGVGGDNNVLSAVGEETTVTVLIDVEEPTLPTTLLLDDVVTVRVVEELAVVAFVVRVVGQVLPL